MTFVATDSSDKITDRGMTNLTAYLRCHKMHGVWAQSVFIDEQCQRSIELIQKKNFKMNSVVVRSNVVHVIG
jgi:hypothetical protein